MNLHFRSANNNMRCRMFKIGVGWIIAIVLVNLALLALGVVVVVKVLQWMGVI